MTREEAIKFLDHAKVFVKDKSEEIQKKLFEIGFTWDDTELSQKVKFLNKPFIFIYGGRFRILKHSSDVQWFYNHPNREITVDDILNITITEPAYRPFKDAAECREEMLKHQPFGWLKDRNNECFEIAYIDNTSHFDSLFRQYTFDDGTPFGIKED